MVFATRDGKAGYYVNRCPFEVPVPPDSVLKLPPVPLELQTLSTAWRPTLSSVFNIENFTVSQAIVDQSQSANDLVVAELSLAQHCSAEFQ